MSDQKDESPSQQEVYKAYIAHKELLAKHEFEVARDCYKWTLTVAGGALALSFTFLKDVVHLPLAHSVWLLGTGWVVLALAVAVCLGAMHIGELAHREYARALTSAGQHSDRFDRNYWTRVAESQRKCWHAPVCSLCSRAAGAFTVLGILLLLTFVFLNTVNQGGQHGEGRQSTEHAEGESTATATASAGGATATATATAGPPHGGQGRQGGPQPRP